MSNNLKKIKLFLFLFATLLIVSCSKDAYDDLSQKESNFKISHIKFKELQTSKNKNLSKSVNSLIAFQKNSKTNKLVYNEAYNFYIDEENGVYVNLVSKPSN